METLLEWKAAEIWDVLCELRPGLVKFDPPIIKLDGRLNVALGYCYIEYRVIRLARKYIDKNISLYLSDILPHELIHQADMDLNGEPLGGMHGVTWRALMLDYGIKPNLAYEVI